MNERSNMSITIGVLSIGGGVGHSILTSVKNMSIPKRIIGFDINLSNFSSSDCDSVFVLPRYTDENYIVELVKLSIENNIDILIPGLDDESLILAKNIDTFTRNNIKVLVSDFPLLELVRNKYNLCKHFSISKHLFVESYTITEAKSLISIAKEILPLIAKPNAGSASSGVVIINSPEQLDSLSDEVVLQEIAFPSKTDKFYHHFLENISLGLNTQISEISVQVIIDKAGKIIGEFMSKNRLKSGVPIEVVPFIDDSISEHIKMVVAELRELGLRGPVNIQGRQSDKGFKIFEINARFTGITGLRSLLGFNELEACIRDWFDLAPSQLGVNLNRTGYRQVENKVVQNYQRPNDNSYKNNTSSILITGGNGFLANELVLELQNEYYLYIASRSKESLSSKYGKLDNLKFISNRELIDGSFNLGMIDVIIHTAFARPGCEKKDYSESLQFTQQLFSKAAQIQVPKIINISSQSVYGPLIKDFHKETDFPVPETLYGIAKYSAELLLEGVKSTSPHTIVVNLRPSSIINSSSNELIYSLLRKMIASKPITINDGEQTLDMIDVKDVVKSITLLIKKTKLNSSVYNIGNIKKFTLNEIVEIIDLAGSNRIGKKLIVDSITTNRQLNYGVNLSRIMNELDYNQQYSLEKSIDDLLQTLI